MADVVNMKWREKLFDTIETGRASVISKIYDWAMLLFKLFRITRLMKILRVFKFIRYSRNVQILFRVLRKESRILMTVFWIAVLYILITALIMFNVEESAMFEDFFDALYWATTTLTTVGYGDICPSTDIGRVISMLSAILGVAVIALPSGVITASYLDELREMKKEKGE